MGTVKQVQKPHESFGFNRDYIAMTLPPLMMGTFFYGPRVLLLAIVAVLTAKLTDRLAAAVRSRKYDPTENLSVVVALIIVLLMPASVQYRIVVMAVVVAVLVGKEAFGGPGSYPFNPAAVGYCAAAISWPQYIFRYPEPLGWLSRVEWTASGFWRMFSYEGVTLAEGPALTLKNGGVPNIDTWNLLLGNYVGPLGVTASLVVLSCAVYLVVRKRMPLSAPISFLVVTALVAFLFPRAPENAWSIMPWYNWLDRLSSIKFELLAGALPFAAVFLVPEPCTLPKNTSSRIIYGAILGVAAMMFRYFGSYELGACFAFLLVNAISGYFDRALAARAGRKKAKEAAKT